jgi:hypothetical protein
MTSHLSPVRGAERGVAASLSNAGRAIPTASLAGGGTHCIIHPRLGDDFASVTRGGAERGVAVSPSHAGRVIPTASLAGGSEGFCILPRWEDVFASVTRAGAERGVEPLPFHAGGLTPLPLTLGAVRECTTCIQSRWGVPIQLSPTLGGRGGVSYNKPSSSWKSDPFPVPGLGGKGGN